jgi:hypothetical protein
MSVICLIVDGWKGVLQLVRLVVSPSLIFVSL